MAKLLSATYDPESGELKTLTLAPGFESERALLRADVLQDLAHAIARLLATARCEAFPAPQPADESAACRCGHAMGAHLEGTGYRCKQCNCAQFWAALASPAPSRSWRPCYSSRRGIAQG